MIGDQAKYFFTEYIIVRILLKTTNPLISFISLRMNQLKNNLLQLRIVSGFADFFKTTSNLYIAHGLIVKIINTVHITLDNNIIFHHYLKKKDFKETYLSYNKCSKKGVFRV